MFAETVSSTWPLRQMMRSCVWLREQIVLASSWCLFMASIPSEVAKICRLRVGESASYRLVVSARSYRCAYMYANLLPGSLASC